MKICENRVNPCNSKHAGSQNHDDRRRHALSKSSGGRNGAVHKSRNHIGKGHNPDSLHAHIHDRRLGGEEA